MNNQNEEKNIGFVNGEPEIFGRSKSREEIKAEEKAAKAARRAAVKEARRAFKEQKKSAPKEKRPELVVMAVILVVIVAGCAAAMAFQLASEKKAQAYERDESFTSWFVDGEAQPELSDDGITAAVNEVYYTKGGYLCVKMTLGNGLKDNQYMDSIEVQISDENEKLIAGGYTNKISDEFFVPGKGTAPYTFYIAPEHVKITDDSLESISYTITATGYIPE